MNQGVGTIIYPVNDMDQAKTRFRTLLGVELTFFNRRLNS